MGIACVPTQNGKSQRAKNILMTGGIGARETEGGLAAKILPLDMITTSFGID